jgi:hypothetical protein
MVRKTVPLLTALLLVLSLITVLGAGQAPRHRGSAGQGHQTVTEPIGPSVETFTLTTSQNLIPCGGSTTTEVPST